MRKLIVIIFNSTILSVISPAIFAMYPNPTIWKTIFAGQSGECVPPTAQFIKGNYVVTCSIEGDNDLKKGQSITVSFDSFYPTSETRTFTPSISKFTVNITSKNICDAFGCHPGLTMYYKNSVNTILEGAKCDATYVTF